MSKFNILFLMSGSIAGFKACSVISELVKKDFNLQIAVSPSTFNFIGESTLEGLSGKPILKTSFESGNAMKHIQLERWADLIVLCPATANTINQMASGITNNIIGEIFLAHDFKKSFLVFPAMNSKMYEHPITQRSIEKLKDLGIFVSPTGVGDLACGEQGLGRMLEPEQIISIIEKFLPNKIENLEADL